LWKVKKRPTLCFFPVWRGAPGKKVRTNPTPQLEGYFLEKTVGVPQRSPEKNRRTPPGKKPHERAVRFPGGIVKPGGGICFQVKGRKRGPSPVPCGKGGHLFPPVSNTPQQGRKRKDAAATTTQALSGTGKNPNASLSRAPGLVCPPSRKKPYVPTHLESTQISL